MRMQRFSLARLSSVPYWTTKGCLRRYKTLDEYRESSSLELKELEAFFRSSWCDILCELCGYESGEGIMLQCKKEAMKRWHRKGNTK